MATQDLKSLSALWSANYTGLWQIDHLEKFMRLAMLTDWMAGLKQVYESFTTETILLSLPVEDQLAHCAQLLSLLVLYDPASSVEKPSSKRLVAFLRNW